MPAPLHEARKTLGLGAEKITATRIAQLRTQRAALAQRLATTTNRKRHKNLHKELGAFDAALALVIAEWEAARSPQSSPSTAAILYLTLWLLTIAAGITGWTIYQKTQHAELLRDARIRELETVGWHHIDNRRWKEADAAFSAIAQLIPHSALAATGHAAAHAGRKEEETQFIAYWTGQALAELEAGRLDEAATAAQRVLASYPKNKDATSITQRIAEARLEQQILTHIAEVRALIEKRDWKSASAYAAELSLRHPSRKDIADITHEARAGWERLQQDQANAESLFQQASARNTGEFNQQALDWLREAATLAPERTDIAALLETMASYKRTLRVPGDYATPDEALENSRDNDRIVLGKGTWNGPLVIRKSVELQGASAEETIVRCAPNEGNTITILAPQARVSGITFRHDSLLIENGDRFSTATVTHGKTEFVNCRFIGSNGHGLVVIQGAHATIRRCAFRDNAWNGVAAIGKGSTITMEESESSGNFHNGVESWDGATATLKHNRITSNSRNGIHADLSESPIICEDNTLSDNREFGITLTAAKTGHLTRNKSRANLLGGILVRSRAASVAVTENECTGNIGPDIVLESGLPTDTYARNTLTPDRTDALHSNAKIEP